MKIIKSIRLVFSEGASDKEYNLQLVENDNLYLVNFKYGRRNGTLQAGTKTAQPVDLGSAEKIYQKLINEKSSKGYLPDGTSSTTQVPVQKEATGVIPQLLNELLEDEVNALIKDANFVFQKKHDGERRMVFKTEQECFGGNRKGQKVSLPSEVIDSVKNLKFEVDGEIVGDTVFVFDLLELNGTSYKNKPYSKRLEALEKCKFGPNLVIVDTARTAKEKKELLARLHSDGCEGVVVKDLRAVYSSSRPNSGGPALKFKFYKTATVKVLEQTKSKRSVQVGVLSNNEFVAVGAVTIPPNKAIPEVGQLIEVRYLYAYKGGSLYQPTYLQERSDLDDLDSGIGQLKYKQD